MKPKINIGLAILWLALFGLDTQAQTLTTYSPVGNLSSQVSNGSAVAPAIVSQPVTQLGQIGGTYGFSVVATGTGPLSYQWYENGSQIAGATGATLLIRNAQAANFTNHTSGANSYYVIVTNGANSVTSNVVALYLDSVGTGMPDWWQLQYFGMVGVAPAEDADGDGVTNLQEYLDGTNPTDPNSHDFTLTVTGPVVVQPAMSRYPAGTTVILSVISETGTYFEGWTGNASGQTNPLSVVINSDMSIAAVTSTAVHGAAAPFLSASNFGASVGGVLLENNGEILVAGGFHTLNGRPQWDLGLLHADGSLDTSFFAGAGNELPFTLAGRGARGMVQQSDGRIVVIGFTGGPPAPPAIFRVNTDGSLDNTFVASHSGYIKLGAGQPNVLAVALQGDGKILIGGEFDSVGGTTVNGIARLNTDGSVDTSFNPGGSGLTNAGGDGTVGAGCLQIDPDGQIYIAGTFDTYDGTAAPGLARLNTDGSLDTSFTGSNTYKALNSTVTGISVRPGNGVIAGSGRFTDPSGNPLPSVIALTPTGTLDTTFNVPTNITGPNYFALQPNGQVLAGTSSGIVRLNSDGSVDPGFSAYVQEGQVACSATQSNGQIVIGGTFSGVDGVSQNNLARLNADGSLDTTAPMNAGASPTYFSSNPALAEQPDGKVVVAGNFTLLDNSPISYVGRLNADSSLDPTLNAGGTGPDNPVSSVIVTPSGQIFIAGLFSHYNGTSARGYVRLNGDGTIDPTFAPGADQTVIPSITQAVEQADGKIIVAGSFQSYQVYLERVNTDGTVDGTYTPQLDGAVQAEALQTDGKLLIGGAFSHVNGSAVPSIVRLNSDGTLDTTFNPTNSISIFRVTSLALQPSGQILFSIQNGPVLRLNPDGSLDSSYVTLTAYGVESTVNSIYMLRDGSALVGGTFNFTGNPPSQYFLNALGTPTQYSVKLTPNGAIDPSFSPGLNAPSLAFLMRSNGEIYAAGTFSSDYQQNAVGLVWYSAAPNFVLGTVSVSVPSPVAPGTAETLSATASTVEGQIAQLVFQASTDNINFSTVAVGCSTGGDLYTAQWTPLAEGTYYLRTLALDTFSDEGASVAVANFVVGSPGPPQIQTQPQPLTLTLGNAATFTVVASGSIPLSYQWQFNDVPLPGQTGASLTLPNVSQSQAGSYSVVVQNGQGMVTSNETPLTVQANYYQWQASLGFSGNPAGAPQGDGIPNLLKYFYDINPGLPLGPNDWNALPISGSGTFSGVNYLTLTFRQNSLLLGTTVSVQQTSDLINWQTITSPLLGQVGTDPNTGDPIMEVYVPMTGTKQFIRLEVTGP